MLNKSDLTAYENTREANEERKEETYTPQVWEPIKPAKFHPDIGGSDL